LCGERLAPDAAVCGNCGAKIPRAAPASVPPKPSSTESLLEQLDDLREAVVQDTIAEELETLEKAADKEVQAADVAIGELRAAEEALQHTEERLKEADLSEFVRRVEDTVTRRAHRPTPAPRASAAGAALLAAGGLLSATGLFVLPDGILVGSFVLLAGVTAVALGALVRFRPRRQ
jgi:hypothetical protein